MYRTCICCTADLGQNEAVEGFPVGRTLAFDARRQRAAVLSRAMLDAPGGFRPGLSPAQLARRSELYALEGAWREPEEIAAIADALEL